MKLLASMFGVVAALAIVGTATGQEKEEKRTIHEMTVVLIETKTKGFSGGIVIKKIEIPKETVAKKALAGVKDKQGVEIKEANREWLVRSVKMTLADDSVVEGQVLILKETRKTTLTNLKNIPQVMTDEGKETWYGYYAEYDVAIDSSLENIAQAKKDMDGVQGTWRVVASQTGTQLEKDERITKLKVVVKGDTMTLTDSTPGQESPVEGTINLDPKTKAFDWKVRLGITFTMMGIYELKGDDLKIYFGDTQPFERVKIIDGKSGQLYVLKREKP